jgi:hypothetical protein
VFPLALITCLASHWTWKLVEYAVIAWSYGPEAYADGLRVVDSKRCLLSDGRELTGTTDVVLHVGSGLLMVPIVIGSALTLAWINMRLHGKRWGEVVGGAEKPANALNHRPDTGGDAPST